ncbi:MAG: aspartate-semialdehyde dehydrogenase [Clostridia bacterium]|nr:aspartate-semialdehyde dehydrogenase [Clostridia bacterium]
MISCAIVGATGLVGKTFLKVLEEKNLNIDEYVLFASERSKGKEITFMEKNYIVQELNEESFTNQHFDYALFSAGAKTSEKFAPIAANAGTIVIDNSSCFRMKDNVPLVVPEVNLDDAWQNEGIIANPNCSTIQAVVALKPLHDKYLLKRVIYSTYQAVSGAGQKGVKDLVETGNGGDPIYFPYVISNNCLPHIDIFLENDYTKEEMKMIEETRKIMHLPNLAITATTVRVPVLNCHSESVNVEFENEYDILDLKQNLSNSESVVVLDDPSRKIYPINTFVDGKDEVFVGRIRRDYSVKSGVNLWIVADNIRKGAATNAVQILEKLLEKRLQE